MQKRWRDGEYCDKDGKNGGEKSINTKKEGFLPPNLILFYESLVLYWFFISISRGQQTIEEGFLRQTGGVSAKAN